MSIVEHRRCPWVPGSAGRGSRIQAVADPTGAVSGLALHNQECAPGVGAASHTHDFEEVITVVEGTAEVWMGERRQVVGPGTTVFIPTGVVHGFVNAGPGLLKLQFIIASNQLRATFLP
jgi:quercetin dioxygenase-like cupin family protein